MLITKGRTIATESYDWLLPADYIVVPRFLSGDWPKENGTAVWEQNP